MFEPPNCSLASSTPQSPSSTKPERQRLGRFFFDLLGGQRTLYLDDEHSDVARGTYVLIPSGIEHDFENRGTDSYGFISTNVPAGSEAMMPQLVT